jgi:hypothetical protein|tara:strand:+ start:711 stop:1082 length:372 start_codon:yes stop_codon:yes gene_type:complete
MAKLKHRYNNGDIVKFKFLTGEILIGKIMEKTFKEDKTPDYKIRVEEGSKNRKGFTIYPCMTDARIISLEHTAIQNMKIEELAYRDMINKKRNADAKERKNESDLSKALKNQQDFINGEIDKS